MTDSRRIPGLIGRFLVALSASQAMTAGIWASVPVTQIYLAGALWEFARQHVPGASGLLAMQLVLLAIGLLLSFKACTSANGARVSGMAPSPASP